MANAYYVEFENGKLTSKGKEEFNLTNYNLDDDLEGGINVVAASINKARSYMKKVFGSKVKLSKLTRLDGVFTHA